MHLFFFWISICMCKCTDMKGFDGYPSFLSGLRAQVYMYICKESDYA